MGETAPIEAAAADSRKSSPTVENTEGARQNTLPNAAGCRCRDENKNVKWPRSRAKCVRSAAQVFDGERRGDCG